MSDRPLQGVTILLADDDEEDRTMTISALRERRVANEIRCVGDGEEMTDYLFRRGAYANPDDSPAPGLILLDLNMPRKDGREVLARDQGRRGAARDPGGRADHVEGRGGRRAHLPPRASTRSSRSP